MATRTVKTAPSRISGVRYEELLPRGNCELAGSKSHDQKQATKHDILVTTASGSTVRLLRGWSKCALPEEESHEQCYI
jgi:hypothetical protein